tara:strand:- start:31112 stop:31294 length:183 start_codon:yes stop_codon:yes gene_type:complete
MTDTRKCPLCKGKGVINYLVNQHDDKYELDTCTECKGKGEIHYMSDEDEQDYHDNYNSHV